MHEVHAPPFPGTRGARRGAPVQGDVLAPPDAHPELQPVEPSSCSGIPAGSLARRDSYGSPHSHGAEFES